MKILKRNNYVKEDEFIFVNDRDKILKPIRVPLPSPPDYIKITNYGLKPKDQYFKREVYPDSLKKMEYDLKKQTDRDGNDLTLEVLREYLKKHYTRYEDEINWIKSQWYYRINGKWFFIKGKPYYITGDHWFYINYYTHRTGYKPDFRHKDWKWFNAFKFIYEEKRVVNDKEVYANIGVNNMDFRRSGKTARASSIGINMVTMNRNFKAGIQGKDADNAETLFKKHITMPFRKIPWFFTPLTYGSTDPAHALEFKPQSKRHGGKGTVVSDKDGLESEFDFATTADERKYDGEPLNYFIGDESGKLKQDINSRHEVLKPCVIQGSNRIGFLLYTTTIEEVEGDRIVEDDKASLSRYKLLCDKSNYHEKVNGQTISGLVNIFFPADEGREGFIDKYGFSQIEEARDDILRTRRAYEEKGDYKNLARYKRKFALQFEECFIPSVNDVYFDQVIISDRIKELEFTYTKEVRNGNFERLDMSNLDSPVVFRDSVVFGEGRFYVSMMNMKKYGYESNSFYTKGGHRLPKNPIGVASADPFRHNKTKSKGKGISDAGGAGFWVQDKTLDPNDKPVEEWISNRFIYTYQARPKATDMLSEKEVVSEDMVMATDYFGMYQFPEHNVPDVVDWYEKRKRGGYLLHEEYIKNASLYISEKSGIDVTRTETKDALFKGFGGYISHHGFREKHIELLKDAGAISGVDDMTNYDRLTAAMIALRGVKTFIFKRKDGVKSLKPRFSMGSVYNV